MVIADKNYFGSAFEADLTGSGIALIRPSRKGERPRSGQRFLRPCAASPHESPALTAAIWHNSLTGAAVVRSLTLLDLPI